MTTAIGIDFGNTSTCTAVSKNGKAHVVANSHGDRLTPAMVTLLQEETLTGFASKQASRRHLQSTIKHVKSVLGRRYNDKLVKELSKDAEIQVQLGENESGSLVYRVGNAAKPKAYSSEEIAKLVLKDILETAQSQTGGEVNEAVFTAPVGYLSTYRDALVEVASSAGFEVLRVVSEPAAAALAYGIGVDEARNEPYDIVVFRVGGVTQDVTLLEVFNGMLSIKSYTTRRKGGDVLTDDIANHFASLFEREFKTSIIGNSKAMNKLKVQAEICKHVLSTMPSASCHIDSLHDGLDFNGTMSRSRFEMLVNDHLQAMAQPMKDLVLNSAVDTHRIKKVIMCGGTSTIPRLQTLVSSIVPNADLLCTIPPSEVIALGAAVESGLLITTSDLDLAEDDCQMILAPLDIYIKALDESILAIEAKTPLPCSVDKELPVPSTKEDLEVQLCIKQDELMSLSKIHMENVLEGSSIAIHLKYLVNGHLIFSCVDVTSGNSKSITITC